MNPGVGGASESGNLYVNYAKVLAAGVKNNEISEMDAKLKLLDVEQKLIAKSDAEDMEYYRQQNQALRDFTGSLKSPTTTNCTTIGTSTSCTTY